MDNASQRAGVLVTRLRTKLLQQIVRQCGKELRENEFDMFVVPEREVKFAPDVLYWVIEQGVAL